MCFFKRKAAQKMLMATQEHNELIQTSLKKMKMLTVKLEDKTEICDALSGIYNQYGNCSANGKDATIKQDKNILSQLDNIDLALNKAQKTGDYAEIESIVKKIRIMIAER